MATLALIVSLVALIIALRPRNEGPEREIERRTTSRRKPVVGDDNAAAIIESRERAREQADVQG